MAKKASGTMTQTTSNNGEKSLKTLMFEQFHSSNTYMRRKADGDKTLAVKTTGENVVAKIEKSVVFK